VRAARGASVNTPLCDGLSSQLYIVRPALMTSLVCPLSSPGPQLAMHRRVAHGLSAGGDGRPRRPLGGRLELEDLRGLKPHLLEDPTQFALTLFARQLAREVLDHAGRATDEDLGQLRKGEAAKHERGVPKGKAAKHERGVRKGGRGAARRSLRGLLTWPSSGSGINSASIDSDTYPLPPFQPSGGLSST
jgi:hypothetical protein